MAEEGEVHRKMRREATWWQVLSLHKEIRKTALVITATENNGFLIKLEVDCLTLL
jgi:hypothetical protein